ncbi:MAG: hypothetical protein ACK5JL_07820 [Candidatus Kapaibacterium sp.]|jgi:hypothetical protein
MKNIVLRALSVCAFSALLGVYSCSYDTGVQGAKEPVVERMALTTKSGTFKGNVVVLGMAKPNRTYKPTTKSCEFPARDCFPDITVTPPMTDQLRKLNDAIAQNTLPNHFSSPGNYDLIFPALDPGIVSDIQNSKITLRYHTNDAKSVYTYRVVFADDPDGMSHVPSYGE